jgi:RNA polymerase sigma-70 factor (ECF subfamily)
MAQDEQDDRADLLLVLRCQLGEAAAFDGLARRWAKPLQRYLTSWTSDADALGDLVQDVWLRVLRGLPGLCQPDRFRSWLFGIAHRTAMDRFRLLYREPVSMPEEAADQIAGDDTGADTADRERLLAGLDRALDRLGPVERQTLTLFYLEDIPLNEVARITGVPAGTVKSRLSRGRAQLRAIMKEQQA